jgi:GNAT superfamily N-acetyltransferase
VTVFRRACAAESAELTRIAHAAKRHWGYPDELIELWKEDLTLLPADVEENLVFCAERDGAIAGFYSVSGAGTAAGEIEHMWVLPGHIGTGLGRALGQLRRVARCLCSCSRSLDEHSTWKVRLAARTFHADCPGQRRT